MALVRCIRRCLLRQRSAAFLGRTAAYLISDQLVESRVPPRKRVVL